MSGLTVWDCTPTLVSGERPVQDMIQSCFTQTLQSDGLLSSAVLHNPPLHARLAALFGASSARGNSRDKNLVSRKLWPHKEMPAEECGTGRGGKIHLILKEKVWGPGAHRLPPYMRWRGRGIFLFSPHSCSLVQGHCSLENSPTHEKQLPFAEGLGSLW